MATARKLAVRDATHQHRVFRGRSCREQLAGGLGRPPRRIDRRVAWALSSPAAAGDADRRIMAAVRDRIDGWGALRRKLIHRESFRASVLNYSGNQTVLQSMVGEKCLLTTSSLLSRATRRRFSESRRGHRPDPRSSKLGCRTTSRQFPSQLHLPVRSRLCRPRPLCSSRGWAGLHRG